MTVAAVILSATAEGALTEAPRPAPSPAPGRYRLVRWGDARAGPVARARWRGGPLAHRGRGRAPPARAGRGRPDRPDDPGQRAGPGRCPRHDRGPALAGAHDLGRPGDDHLAHRGPRGRARPAAPADLAGRGRLAAVAAARLPGRHAGDRPDAHAAMRSTPRSARRSRRPISSSAIRAFGSMPTRRSTNCPPTRVRPIHRPATPTSGARTSSRKPACRPRPTSSTDRRRRQRRRPSGVAGSARAAVRPLQRPETSIGRRDQGSSVDEVPLWGTASEERPGRRSIDVRAVPWAGDRTRPISERGDRPWAGTSVVVSSSSVRSGPTLRSIRQRVG